MWWGRVLIGQNATNPNSFNIDYSKSSILSILYLFNHQSKLVCWRQRRGLGKDTGVFRVRGTLFCALRFFLNFFLLHILNGAGVHVYIKFSRRSTMSIDILLQAAEYLDRRDRGKGTNKIVSLFALNHVNMAVACFTSTTVVFTIFLMKNFLYFPLLRNPSNVFFFSWNYYCK